MGNYSLHVVLTLLGRLNTEHMQLRICPVFSSPHELLALPRWEQDLLGFPLIQEHM